uniref:EB domain-containing protein n=1 Tax=Syphacia muris TaxID=451379 RepID=A0A0N5AC05_9BILA
MCPSGYKCFEDTCYSTVGSCVGYHCPTGYICYEDSCLRLLASTTLPTKFPCTAGACPFGFECFDADNMCHRTIGGRRV